MKKVFKKVFKNKKTTARIVTMVIAGLLVLLMVVGSLAPLFTF